MESKGRVRAVSIDYYTQKRIMTFEIDDCPAEEIDRLIKCEDLRITAKRWTDKRSNNANKYFWKLVGLIAEKQHLNDVVVHDKYLSQNKVFILDENGVMKYKITEEEPSEYGIIKWWNREESNFNYAFFSNSGVPLRKPDGSLILNKRTNEPIMSYIYWRIKGTHEMDSKELSRVIEDVVFEANSLGIQTLPPEEAERLLEKWEPTKNESKK